LRNLRDGSGTVIASWLIRALTRSKSARQVMFPSKSISTLVCAAAMCFALAPGAGAQTTTTFLAIGSDPGDPVGNGTDVYLEPQTATFTSSQMGGVGRHTWGASIHPKDNTPSWGISFTLPNSIGFTLGKRYQAVLPADPSTPSLGIGRGGAPVCPRQSGSFTIRQIGADPTDLAIVMMDVDFEARCEGASGGLYGQLRLRSRRSGIEIGNTEMSSLSPVAPGTPLRFSVAMDASVPLEFKFIRYRSSTGRWEIVQDYGFRPVWTWTPTIGDLDDYYLQVWVRARGSANAYDDWRPFGPFSISLTTPVVALVADVALPAPAGTPITWTAAARGGVHRLEYQFVRYSSAAGLWQIVRDWSTESTWLQVTTPADEGDIIVVVVVRSGSEGGSEAMAEAYGHISAPADSFVLTSTISAGRLPPVSRQTYAGGWIPIGTENGLTVSAFPPGHLPGGFYAWMRTPDGGTPGVGAYDNAEGEPDPVAGVPGLWTSGCSSSSTGSFRIFQLEPGPAPGEGRLAADIRQRCGTESTELFAAVRINSSVPLFNMFPIVTNAPAIVGPGTVVTWTAAASSGTGPVEYRFARYDWQQGTWTLVRDWNSDSQYRWMPTMNDIGSYALQVWARTAGSTVPYEDWRNSDTLIVAPVPLTVHDLQWDAARARAGEPLTLEAIAGGGAGDLEYRFVKFERAVGRWTVIREYGPSNRVDWMPMAAGDYDIQVWVREVGSAAAYDTWRSEPLRVR
jgi:hypothetical protein